MNIALWVVLGLLAAIFLLAGGTTILRSRALLLANTLSSALTLPVRQTRFGSVFRRFMTVGVVFVSTPGCAPGLEIGHFTILSTKVYDGGRRYVLLGRFEGSSRPLFGDGNVEEAVEDALRKAKGGIYMTNVLVKRGGFPSGYDVQGDVYGLVSGPTDMTTVEVR
jgi:hypothetical protein